MRKAPGGVTAVASTQTLKARYEIQAGFDYLFVQASSVDDTSMRIRVGSGLPADGTTARRVARVGTGPGGTTVQCL